MGSFPLAMQADWIPRPAVRPLVIVPEGMSFEAAYPQAMGHRLSPLLREQIQTILVLA